MFEEVPHPCPLPQRRGNRSLLIRKDDFFGGLGLVHREAVNKPLPPELRSASWVHPPPSPRDGWDEFHDLEDSSSRSPWRSWWPSVAVPSLLLVQLRQVISWSPENARPSGCEPVRMSCIFGLSPRAFMVSPFSLSAVSLLILLLLADTSRTSSATIARS
jgi:hypothetical protein